MHPSRTSLCLCRGSDTILSIANADCLCRGSDTADCLCRGSTMDATAPPTANAAAAPPEDGPYTRPRLSIVDAAATSTAGAAAAPAKVGPTWWQGPCLHPEPEPAPLPPSPSLLPPAGRTGRSDNARDPPPAAMLPPPPSLQAGGDDEDAEAAGALCRNFHGSQLHLPARTNIRQAWGKLELSFPLDPGDPVGGAAAFRRVGLSAPEPMLLSTSRRTSPPPRQSSRVRTKAGMCGGSNTVPAEGGTTARKDRCAARMSSLAHKAMSGSTMSHSTACASGKGSML